ncbi:MAG: hypothetical protein ABEJ95_04900 [Candidatus Nanohalobium sp.]
MSDVPDSVKWGYIVLAPLIFILLAFVQFSQGYPRGAAIMVIVAVLTLPNVHRFWKEIQMGQEINDERSTQVGRKSGFIAFFATLLTAILVGGAAKISRIVSEPGFLTFYDDLIIAPVGATIFAVAQIWYNHFGTQRNIKEIILGDEE